MIWEITNPHDPYTIKADSFLPAAAAVLLIGEGRYGLDPVDEGERMPLFLFTDSESWLKEKFGDFGEWLKDTANVAATAEALDSVMSVGPDERDEFDTYMARLPRPTREVYRARLHNNNRSSLGDIGTSAWELAKQLRAVAEIGATT